MSTGNHASHWRSLALVLSVALFVVYLLVLTAYISHRRMFWADEFLGWFIISDPSWRHAMQSWNLAIDSGGLVYEFLARGILSVTGVYPDVMRYFGALCLAAATLGWTSFLRRRFGLWPGVLSVAAIWFCSPVVMFHVAETRFYLPYLAGATACFLWAVHVEEKQPPAWQAFVGSFVIAALLAGTHLLGYGWILLPVLARLCLLRLRPASIASSMGFVMSATVFIPERAIFKLSNNLTTWWLPRPTWRDVVHFYLELDYTRHTPVVLLVLLLLMIAAMAYGISSGRALNAREKFLVLLLLLFALMPVGFALVSQVVTPVFTSRYLIPSVIGMSGLMAWSLSELQSPLRKVLGGPLLTTLTTVTLVLIVSVHALTLRQVTKDYYKFSDLDPLLSLQGTEPVLLQDLVMNEQIHLYHPEQASRFVFLTLTGQAFDPAVLQGYWNFARHEDEFFAQNRRILFIQSFYTSHDKLDRWLQDPGWTVRRLGTLRLRNDSGTLYEMVAKHQ